MNDTRKTEVLGRLDQAITVFSILIWVAVIYYAYTQLIPRALFGIVFLGSFLVLYILMESKSDIEDEAWFHLLLLGFSLVIVTIVTTYLFLNFDVLFTERVGYALDYEYVLAFAFTAAMVYLTWRAFGWTFLFVLIGGLFYGYFGPWFPGIIGHGGLSHTRLLLILVLEIEGFFGFLTRLMAAWIALFLLYAGFLQAYGAFDLILRLAAKSTNYIESGVAQTAVIASAIVGSINGSQTSNAGMTGAFTIPLMKKNGIKGSTAAGIEAVASTKGQVLPPVMGATAFVMASLLGTSYVEILKAGLLPAFIMVVVVTVAVHFTSIRQIDSSMDTEMIEGNLGRQAKATESLRFGIPFLVLVWTLGIAQYTVITAALWTVTSMIITGVMFPLIGRAVRTKDVSEVTVQAKESFHETVFGFRRGAFVAAPIAIILASINGVVDVLTTTGVPGAISLSLINISGGVLFFAAVLAMISCILLGLGMPTTASYTVVAILIAPTLQHQFLVPEMSAHFFVFYAAILSGLTPPIATCAAVAAGIAEADFFETCYEAIKISAPLFILPFSFIYHPALVDGEILTYPSLLVSSIVLIGALSIAYGINYRFAYRRRNRFAIRFVYVTVGALVMMYPSQAIQLAGITLLVAMLILQKTDISAKVYRHA